MTEKVLTDCRISFIRAGSRHLQNAPFLFAIVTVADAATVKCFGNEMLDQCAACGNGGGELPAHVWANFTGAGANGTVRLALFHEACFNALRVAPTDMESEACKLMERFAALLMHHRH